MDALATLPSLLRAGAAPAGPPYGAMLGFLLATSVLLGLDVWTALRGRRRLHALLAWTTVPTFLAAVWFADEVGTFWDFHPFFLTLHLVFAISGFFLSFLVVGTGTLHLWGKVPKALHRFLALLFLGLVIYATTTGILIFLTGEPKAG